MKPFSVEITLQVIEFYKHSRLGSPRGKDLLELASLTGTQHRAGRFLRCHFIRG